MIFTFSGTKTAQNTPKREHTNTPTVRRSFMSLQYGNLSMGCSQCPQSGRSLGPHVIVSPKKSL
jgi:hypothetical protein